MAKPVLKADSTSHVSLSNTTTARTLQSTPRAEIHRIYFLLCSGFVKLHSANWRG